MTPKSARRETERGQAVVLFALLLVVVLGAAGLLVDGGMAWANRRQAQAAADFAALAAAKAVVDGGSQCNAAGLALARTAASQVADLNGFSSVQVEYPAASSASHNGCSYVRVTVSRPMATTFSRVMGQTTWMAQASSVAGLMQVQSAAAANCTFCSLNSSNDNHTLLVQLGSTLIVDGDIYVNSSNGLKADDPNSAVKLKDWYVGGDGFDIFGDGGRIEAERINVVGGWETHDDGIAVARTADCDVSQRPDPLAYATLSPPITSNVCIHQPVLADPLAAFPAPDQAGMPTRSTRQAKYGGNLTYTILPGVYVGGIETDGAATLIMTPGIYYIAGGGFNVKGGASVIAEGVTIYVGSAAGKKAGKNDGVDVDTNGRVVLSPPTTGTTAGMTIFMARTLNTSITLDPSNTLQCASVAGSGQPQGCIGGISGTIYAAHEDATVIVKAAGTANLQIISGRLLIQNGATARFTFNSAGFAAGSVSIKLVE